MFKLVKKTEYSRIALLVQRLLSIVAALSASAVVILILGYNPLEVFSEIIKGSLGSSYRVQETIVKAIPLLIMSLGIAVCFKMKFTNIGAEGQFYMGAMAATFIALNFPGWPSYILLPAMFVAAVLFGGVWCLIPGTLKLKLGTSEILVTLMLNYIGIKLISYLQYGPWQDPQAYGFPRIARFSDNAVLPKVFGIHCGWIIALVLVVAVYILLSKSKLGYEISVLGESQVTAKYAGINSAKVLILAVLIGGGLSGIAGMIQASAIEKSLTDQLSGGMGYTAIITAWLGQLSAPVIFVVSFLFAALIQGSAYIQSSMQIPSAVAGIIQGIILLFVLASELFSKYKIVRIKNEREV